MTNRGIHTDALSPVLHVPILTLFLLLPSFGMSWTLLFSYGTLRNESVQLATFGRELTGRADSLPGYAIRLIPILDLNEVPASGQSHYANAEPSSNPEDAISGTVFEITDEELAAADQYEAPADYRRIRLTLQSGTQAWVYIHSATA